MAAPVPATADIKVCAFCGHGRDFEQGSLGDFMGVRASEWGDLIYVHRLCALWSPKVSTQQEAGTIFKSAVNRSCQWRLSVGAATS